MCGALLVIAPAVSGRDHSASGAWENHLDGGVQVAKWWRRPEGSDRTGWDASRHNVNVSVTLYASGCPEESMAIHTEMQTEMIHCQFK